MRCIVIVIFALVCICEQIEALNNGLALTPPMGWMSWLRYRCLTDCVNFPDECISENLFKNAADIIVAGGYRDAGYEYIIIDDCWMEPERNPITNELVPDRLRFPNGMKYLADYIHARGLKFGIYEDYGTKTCEGYPGIINTMELDAQTFAKWDVDYVKIDGCYAGVNELNYGYPRFGQLLNETGRPMVYSCSWPVYQELSGRIPNYEALKTHCNLWRNWFDIHDSYVSMRLISEYFAANQSRIQPQAGPGHWNDPDMLIIGNYGLSIDQSQTQMALWAILAAPLIMSNDLKNIRPEFRKILLNKAVIKVNQDPLGIQGIRVGNDDGIQTWIRPILPAVAGYYSYAVAWSSVRDDGYPHPVAVRLQDLGLTFSGGYRVTDLFTGIKLPGLWTPDRIISLRVNPTGTEMYKFALEDYRENVFWYNRFY